MPWKKGPNSIIIKHWSLTLKLIKSSKLILIKQRKGSWSCTSWSKDYRWPFRINHQLSLLHFRSNPTLSLISPPSARSAKATDEGSTVRAGIAVASTISSGAGLDWLENWWRVLWIRNSCPINSNPFPISPFEIPSGTRVFGTGSFTPPESIDLALLRPSMGISSHLRWAHNLLMQVQSLKNHFYLESKPALVKSEFPQYICSVALHVTGQSVLLGWQVLCLRYRIIAQGIILTKILILGLLNPSHTNNYYYKLNFKKYFLFILLII